MATNPLVFDSLISRAYDDYLGPFLFEPYAFDLAARIDTGTLSSVLELACGTGRLTRHLIDHLPQTAELLATDINPGMLAIAQEKVLGPNIYWDTVDMAKIPFNDNEFDLVVCQFGLMFAPDKLNVLKEIRRVLKTGGILLFNVWGNIEDNPIWKISNQVINSFMADVAMQFAQGPFSMSDEKAVLSLLQQAGFSDYGVDSVLKTGLCNDAADAARGITIGLPIYKIIMQRDPALLPRIQEVLEEVIGLALGEQPVQSLLHAWIFSAVK